MDKIEIKLKECCLTCEHFDPRGVIGFGMCATLDGGREIACWHMKVCAKYNEISPVVRCKDCTLRGTEDCAMQYSCTECGGQWSWESDNDFCSYGRERDKEIIRAD